MKKSEIMKEILVGLAAVGAVVLIAAAVPSLPIALAGVYKPLRRYKDHQIRRGFAYLKQKKMIGIGQEKGKTIIKLTEAGKSRLVKFQLNDLRIKLPKKWDGKWRMVIFDIPERFKVARQALSAKLRELKFELLQKSVWICPYSCQDEIDFIVAVYEVDPFVRLFTIDSSQLEKYWQKKFNLI
ncbi:MAG: hypothetical protein A2760_03855 [Candidatus Doudnabacteria bacterium RIFCSPHIGHO2_01_FULL_50_67]|uniref:Transcriptional repressor PaaX-like central Cas2-like domain-containing protein n=1 Tax=Candidatus Doudnabacteria bacterium RIFCSPHIGHO2_12_FULL_48_16 TaxID=1817838 RepID=A0A1F5PJL9_9BACT|nr:MAG: hypothetical protein A3B77_02650 [Candidatus Doudnabacteria bacterium RIFCSPHIGHO2_02_FULL_49_24]OGE89606.1 MAG: hypothetical protein A2760_03855 [Candidatus Doudnabacteria bacterium RIFCSPHIGHO2_01_FULL_50_67]OGE90049.1 MAG: hypothetical protein A3E29_02985 [Candidatus Doudnabacteria bacterium RIFCSPHIGHO2_12_FULL_48_16]OGE96622.1 MAG: hypothetical protein A2990_00295 [Candidatus Doudnabacteria bacterium RIFCSPLOWO2_01_FULL_49_40]OGF03514.1 MAG: hypothetical protein A3H14_03480 [Candid